MQENHITAPTGSGRKLGSRKTFWRDTSGSATLEFVIWLPIFATLIALVMNISMVFFTESQMLRVVQDGNRAFSLGRLENNVAVEDYILSRLTYLQANITVATTISGGFVQTTLVAPASDLMPFNLIRSAFNGVNINVNAQHIIEF